MLGNFEKRYFSGGEKVWLGRYRSLTNVLHWHFECEIIRIAAGSVQIRIGENCYDAAGGDCFFCGSEELHYIISHPGAIVDIVILDTGIAKDITGQHMLVSPKLSGSVPVERCLQRMADTLACKGRFYREALENDARGLVIDIFRSCETAKRGDRARFYRELISKLNEEFAFITFDDAVRWCGYSPAHFSKMFRQLSGMTFSEYLNILRVENAITLMRTDPAMTMAAVSMKCGFSTVRNFNRVFKALTGHSPRTLPPEFTLAASLQVSGGKDFDPTQESSVLLQE